MKRKYYSWEECINLREVKVSTFFNDNRKRPASFQDVTDPKPDNCLKKKSVIVHYSYRRGFSLIHLRGLRGSCEPASHFKFSVELKPHAPRMYSVT